MLSRYNRRELYQVLGIQLLFAMMTVVSFGCVLGKTAGWSALYGSAISVFPTWLFAGMLFRYQGASKAKKIIHQLYVGEGMKLFACAGLFGMIIAWATPCWWVLFVSFILTQLGLAVAPLFGSGIKK